MEKKKYYPSNGTEGEIFISHFCMNCIHEKWLHTQVDSDKKCEILSNTMIYNKQDKEYPSEWTYDDAGNPTCTAFVKWDWGNDEDGLNEPPEPPIDDPNQLCLPLSDIFQEAPLELVTP